MLLRRNSGKIEDTHIDQLPHLITADTIVVINDARVRKARLWGTSATGGRVEFLLLEETQPGLWKVLCSKAKKQKPGKTYIFPRQVTGTIVSGSGSNRIVKFDPAIREEYLDRYGHVPLPPYIKRNDTPEDEKRYQTVYARTTGSAAAPTAGLHITREILTGLEKRGIAVLPLTLHIGLGTFMPIHKPTIEEHRMHEERYVIPEETARRINEGLSSNRRVLAVGTTVVRALESAWQEDHLQPGKGKTAIFIYPGYRFRVVSQLLTNFHTPKSTLLLLVSAFAGREQVLSAYRRAVSEGYRFFSYGDAMLIL